MNTTTTPSEVGRPFSDSERQGLRDFWTVYERHYDDVSASLLERVAAHQSLRQIIEATPPDQREEQQRASRERTRRAILEGDWEPYIDDIRGWGVMYASGGLEFSAWFEILREFRPLIYPHLIAEYGQDPERLLSALLGMDSFIDNAMAIIGEEYLAAKERIIAGQEETVRRYSTSRAVLTSLAEGVVTTDTEGRITALNPAMARMLGVREDDVVGQLHTEAYPLVDGKGRHIAAKDRLLSRAIDARAVLRAHGFGCSLVSRDGSHVPVSITASPILDEDDELVGGVDVIRDVSHEFEVDQMKSSLISTVSHELRTPLTMIRGFAELLLERDLEPDRARLAQEQIRDSSDRLGRLIDDLLSVSKIDSGKLEVRTEPMDLPEAVRIAVASFERDRPIQLEVPDRVPQVLADRDKVLQIVTNLVSNAIKYSPQGSPVTVCIRPTDDCVETSVADRGLGLSEEDSRRVFDKFFRVRRPEVDEAKGTGLGLYITKSLLDVQNGDIRVDSRRGEGTTFAFTLPRASGARREDP
jgi:PAS domain S-box-containing protein